MPVSVNIISIWLADDDKDDNMLFQDVLAELSLNTKLTNIQNGEQLMMELKERKKLPDVLFLDLNMPRKNGFDCLREIKKDENLNKLPVIVFSTSYEIELINQLYETGALYYIRKPNKFEELKDLIKLGLTLIAPGVTSPPAREKFVLSPKNFQNGIH